METKKKLAIVAMILLIVAAIEIYAAATLMVQYRIRSRVIIEYPLPPTKNIKVGVYSDEALTQPVTEIDWGTFYPGDTKNWTVYIKNEGDVDATLALSTESWSPPEAEAHITLSWNHTGTTGDVIPVGEVWTVDLTLSVNGSIVGINEFSFDIVFTATEPGPI